MKILHLCPANCISGGPEGIHNFVRTLNNCGADAKILYVGDSTDPQPEQYRKYACDYLTEFPADFHGVVIFPEVWANQVVDPKYKDCITAVNWQGVDVYDWHNPPRERGKFLKNKNTIHIANSEYAMCHLRSLGLNPVKISDCLNDAFYQQFEQCERKDIVLYNPTPVKMTSFERIVISRCTTELGIKFEPLQNYDRDQLIDLMRHSKLYIDFGVFSGRERLPREAVMCGCCILTSHSGTAGYFEDNSIPDQYKIDDLGEAITMIKRILKEYDCCRPDFDLYRKLLTADKTNYPNEVRNVYEIFCNNSSI